MTWEYLQTKILDPRMMLAAGYLHGKTKDAHIVDLDCGTSRILNFINHDFASYKGNDIELKFLRKNQENMFFYHMNDKYFADKIERCDILLVFGHGASRNPLESSSVNNSILVVVNRCRPKIIILEGSTFYQQKFNMLGDMVKKLTHYDTDLKVNLVVDSDNKFANREIRMLTRKSK